MTTITRPITGRITQPLSSKLPSTTTLSKVRIKLTGGGTSQWDMLDPTGVSIRTGGNAFWGYNLGVYEYYALSEATAFIAQLQSEGCKMVRLVGENRWSGSPGKLTGDSRNIYSSGGTFLGYADAYTNMKNPANFTKLKTFARACANAGMWFVICMEGDIRQSGTQDATNDPTTGTYDHSLQLVQGGEAIPGGLGDWGLAGGYNVFTSQFMFAQALEEAKMLAREFRSYPYLFAYEFLSEPLPPSGKFPGNVPRQFIYPGSGSDGVYDSTWSTASPGPGLGRRSIEDYYRALIGAASAIDPNTPFIVGGRGGYNLQPEGGEIITALSDLVAANKIIFTWDRLGGGTNQVAKTPGVWLTAAQMNVPMFMNQLGERNSGDGTKDPGDPNTYGLRAAVRTAKQFGCPGTIWDRRGNGTSGYGSEYSNGDGDWAGAGGTYTNNEPRRTNLANCFAERLAALESAAIAAATAENAALFYVKPDFSNVVKSGGAIPYTLTSISAVVDPLSTGIVFSAVGTITIDYALKDGGGNSYLPDKRPVLRANGAAGNYLAANMSYWGSPGNDLNGTSTGDENMTCIVGGIPSNTAAQQSFLCLINTSGLARYPQLVSASTQFAQGKAGSLTLLGTNTTTANVPHVLTLIKSGVHPATAISMWVNGIDDTGASPGYGTGENVAGTANTLTGQTIASATSLSRFNIFGTGNVGDFNGPIVGWCIARQAMSAANAHAIGRFFAHLMGGGYKA